MVLNIIVIGVTRQIYSARAEQSAARAEQSAARAQYPDKAQHAPYFQLTSSYCW